MEKNPLIAIDLPYAYFYIEVENGKVVGSAPLARWMIGKSFDRVKEWVEGKGGKVVGNL